MMRYRFTWFGSKIFVSPCTVDFGSGSVLIHDFDRFADIVRGPYTFPRGVSWETNLSDRSTFRLFYKKGLSRCVQDYHRAQVTES